ncbi:MULTISPECIES: RsmB/NOP family class I SAM-dependent RNA methyltransferase [unclassified Sphingobium]|uniref:RsmB/NOP family class I SAM-dependent RNA methyltransferase n=1 Tax=unclassified Sphingobium TaxID=2611147 RepID=UPI000D17D024|nr:MULTISPECIES: RsmB/NOP family class I SAM-dependent RNA methyltransferase [unclassified Sphingobium]MBG6117929.1 16S rRNA (cytosine967-C5)-methyltransferase [Sphingobium sp. JAI105]PSO12249.1 SAM-dependent methyltransferase [Sphingobium sp. AEW4]TWD08572.1 16S rRNA (cytosine967-C5)-methyltransferase [Sphingobium sp. AEW010]TWD25796.1 16S rRNA (cytosine967-C5)-methyltransferase [Sphingobium sp. AEW013]TWD28368.1 16S rRNA (cytosine967-C5)-methyltransferase [Sphingobium sp. AEW001]
MAQSSRPADVPGLPARRSALKLLDAVLRRGDPLEIALHGACQGLADRADRALVHAIAAEVLRHLPDLDALIDGATRLPLPDDAKARMVLRIALVQVLVLGTAPHAAIATALPLVDGGPRKLVHGVFGTVTRSAPVLPDPPTLPAAVADRWAAQWGSAMVEAAARAYAIRPPVDVSLRDPAATAEWAAQLGGVSLAPGHVRLPDGANIPDLPGFADGAWWVQDVAASCPARLLGAGEGRHVLDLCAAPGGKTMQLAAAGWRVTAIDQSKKRLERLTENLTRTGLSADVVQADLRQWQPDQPVDAILLDAPCTATGIYRRHPDVLHRIGPRQIAELAELQGALLARAADWLKPGGVLLYATCSLEQAEGEEQITRLLAARPDFALVPAQAGELPDGMTPTSQGWLRTLPDTLATQGGADGFFIARLAKATN